MEVRGSMFRTIITILVFAIGACSVGEVPIGGDDTTTDASGGNAVDKQSYNQQVAPLVTRCTGCHGSTQDPNLANYDLLKPLYKQKPSTTNKLITKDVDDGTVGQHQGTTYLNDTEKQAVGAWIDGQTGM